MILFNRSPKNSFVIARIVAGKSSSLLSTNSNKSINYAAINRSIASSSILDGKILFSSSSVINNRNFVFSSPIRSFANVQQNSPTKKIDGEILRKKLKSLSQKEIDDMEKDILRKRHRDQLFYIVGFAVFMLGGCWAAIPIYRMFCEDSSSGGGMGKYKRDEDKIDTMHPIKDRSVKITFNADAGGALAWKFRPLQDAIYVHPGETALAFFTATNSTDKPIIGVSTYNIIPYDAAAYFNKIQCFCFEEQLLNPGEQVDLPIFFYLDPDFAYDPLVGHMDEIVLSYTFFQSKANEILLKRPTNEVAGGGNILQNIGGGLVGKQLETAKVGG